MMHSAKGFRALTLKDQTTAMLSGISFEISSFRNRPSLPETGMYGTVNEIGLSRKKSFRMVWFAALEINSCIELNDSPV